MADRAPSALRCSVPQERSVLERFFSASRLRDRTALSKFATVVFDPLEQGIITSFEIARCVCRATTRKAVTISAPVKLPDGAVVAKTRPSTGRRDGAWMVTTLR